MNIVVVGAQWGDEGKGKLIDLLAKDLDFIVRYQGVNNAGHTVVVGNKEYIFHLVPSAVLHKSKTCCIGNGVVVDPKALIEEIETLKKQGVSINSKNLKVSFNCHIVFPYHRILDKLREGKRNQKLGTTGRGIGPCYSDKIARCGIRLVDILNPEVFREKLEDNLLEKNEIFEKVYQHPRFSLEEIYSEYLGYAGKLKEFATDVAVVLNSAIRKDKSILFEGAQGTFLDIDFGTYPFVTSSSAISGGACIGCGVSPVRIDKVVGVIKAYTTRVGEGPFPTQFEQKLMQQIRSKGKEFGATTGRPRRCGWFDAVMGKYAIMINGIKELAVMKLDVLDELKTIKVAVAYKHKGKLYKNFPNDLSILNNVECVYKEYKGWGVPTCGINSYNKLPKNAIAYLEDLQNMLGAKIKFISVGSKRQETIRR